MIPMEKKYKGVVVPMVTPLNEKREIDIEAVARIMEAFARYDISPLLLGTTGESASFSQEESHKMVKAAIASKSAHQQVYAGLVSNNVAEQAGRGQQYLDLGVDAVVATLPAYYILSADQMKRYFERLAEQLQGPLLMYNIKATTQMSIPLSVVEEMSHHPHIWGLKDSERDGERMAETIGRYRQRPDFSFFCGWGAQSADSIRTGADGIVPSTGNIVPEIYQKLYAAAANGEDARARHYQNLSDEVAKIYQSGRSLGASLSALKVLMKHQGLCEQYMKPPLSELEQGEVEEILAQWSQVNPLLQQ